MGISGSVIGLSALFASLVLYSSAKPFSVVSQPPSDLGWGPNGSGVTYRAGLLIAPFLLLMYGTYLTETLLARVREYKRVFAPRGEKRMAKIVIAGACAGMAVVLGAFAMMAVPDQNGDAFYLHDAGAVFFVAFQPIATIAFTTAMTMTWMGSPAQVVAAGAVAAFAISVASFMVPLLWQYNLYALVSMLVGMQRDERKPLLDGIAAVAWWFPLSEFGLVVATYAWCMCTSMASLRWEQSAWRDAKSPSQKEEESRARV